MQCNEKKDGKPLMFTVARLPADIAQLHSGVEFKMLFTVYESRAC